jgi:hypothetical protein
MPCCPILTLLILLVATFIIGLLKTEFEAVEQGRLQLAGQKAQP